MTPYSSTSGKQSGVTAYKIEDNFIIVEFYPTQYKYSYGSCGRIATETMKQRALASNGLSTFISQNSPNYEWKR